MKTLLQQLHTPIAQIRTYICIGAAIMLGLGFFLCMGVQTTYAAIAFDAFSEDANAATGGTGDFSWTHTPVGTPRGVLVYVAQRASSGDQVNSVTYGSLTLTRVARACDTAGEVGCVYAYVGTSSIPVGPQTVSVNETGGGGKHAAAFTFTALRDTEVVAFNNSVTADAANPSRTLTLDSRGAHISLGLFSGQNAVTGITPLSGWTSRDEEDFTNEVAGFYTNNTLVSTSVGVGWTQAIEDAAMVAVALAEQFPPSISGTLYESNGITPITTPATITAGIQTGIDSTATEPNNWATSSAAGNDDTWRSVAYGNGIFVAVSGGTDRVMTSTDGVTWTARTAAAANTWQSVTYGNGLFVAVACGTGTTCNTTSGTRVMTSLDGITWTARTAASLTNQWQSVTYGNGLFVAVSLDGTNRVMTSPDGITWTARSAAGNDDTWQSVTYGNGIFVAVGGGTDRVMTSTDGVTWTARTAAAASNWKSVTYGNGLFVAVACGTGTTCNATSGTRVMTSTDGITWTARTAASLTNQWQSVTYGNGYFVSVSSSGTNRVMTSTDGITWTARTVAGDNDTWQSVAYGNGLFVAVSNAGDRVMYDKVPVAAVSAVTNGSGNFSITLPDFTTTSSLEAWATSSAAGNDDTWRSIAYGNGTFVAVGCKSTNCGGSGSGDEVMTSPDGITWTARRVDADTDDWRAVTYGNGLFVAVSFSFNGGTDRVMTSPDGINWTVRSAAGNDDVWSSITYGNGLFVAVGAGIDGDTVMTSPDGITWTAHSAAGNDDFWQDVTYGNGLFVAVGSGAGADLVMTSPDGITWTARSAAENNDNWYGVTYGNGLFVAVGEGPDRVMTSPDGITWTARSAAGNDDAWFSITYGNGLFVAVGGGTDRVMTSPDGVIWTVRSAAGNNDFWSDVTFANNRFVAVGIGPEQVMSALAPILNQTTPITLFVDGSATIKATTLTYLSGNTTSGIHLFDDTLRIAYASTTQEVDLTNQTFYNGSDDSDVLLDIDGATTTVGQSGVDTSPWITRPAENDEGWFDVTYGNGLFVAVGRSGQRVLTSPDGITWTARSAASDNDYWKSVTYGNGLFVAVGCGGSDSCLDSSAGDRVMTSPDGITWTARSAAGDNDNWQSVIYGNGLFVAVGCGTGGGCSGGGGDAVMTSPDGTTWTVRSAAGNNDDWYSVTYGNSTFVAVSRSGDRVMTSPDGTTWTVRSAAGNDDGWYGVTYGNGLFVAVGLGNDRVMTSPDGTTWTVRSAAGSDDNWLSVTYGNGLFVAVGNFGDPVMISPDGITWSARSAAGSDDDWYGITYGNGLFVAVGIGDGNQGEGGSAYDLIMVTSKIDFDRQSKINLLVNTGTTFTPTSNLTLYGGMAQNGAIDFSNTTLTLAKAGPLTGSFSGSNSLGDVVVTAERDDPIWDTASIGANTDTWNEVVYGEGVYVAVGTTGLIATSTDLVTWTSEVVVGTEYTDVIYTGSEFLAISTAGVLVASADGSEWDFLGSLDGGTQAIACSPTRCVVPVFNASDFNSVAIYSDDLFNTFATSSLGSFTLFYDIIFADGQFVAVGANLGTGPIVATSPDGLTWTITPTPVYLNNIVYGNGTYVGIGADGGVNQNVAAYSYNGNNWFTTINESAVPNQSWQGVTYGNGTFVAVGKGGSEIMTSFDGITWTKSGDPRGAGFSNGVTYGNGTFVAVGATSAAAPAVITLDQTALNNTSVRFVTASTGDFTVASSGVAVASTSLTVTGNMLTTGTFTSQGALDVSGNLTNSGISALNQFTVGGSLTNTGTIVNNATSTIGASFTQTGVFTNGGLLELEGTGNLTTTETTLGDVRISGNITGQSTTTIDTLTITSGGDYNPGNQLTLTGDFTQNGGIDFANTKLLLTGSATQTVSGTFSGANALGEVELNLQAGLGDWISRKGFTEGVDLEALFDVTYGGGQYVAVGAIASEAQAQPVVFTSPDGVVWTFRFLDPFGDYEGILYSVTYAEGLFVATGIVEDLVSSYSVFTSPNGITWTPRVLQSEPTTYVDVTHGNGTFVAVGSNETDGIARVMYSSDGLSWATTTAAGNDDFWYGVTYGNGTFVAVGEGPDRVMTSSNGITWTARSAAGDNDTWWGVTYGGGQFVAVGGDGDDAVMTSPDGITWTARSAPSGNSYWSDVTYGSGQYVAVGIVDEDLGYFDQVMTSNDGVTWAVKTATGNVFDNWYGITNNNGLVVAVGGIEGSLGATSAIMSADLGVATTTSVLLQNAATIDTLTIGTDSKLVPTGDLTLTGDYTNNGVFAASTNEVILAGTTVQTATGLLSGESAFYDLTITNTSQTGSTSESVIFGAPLEVTNTFTMGPGTSVAFLEGATSTLQNINLQGAEGDLVYLRGAIPTTFTGDKAWTARSAAGDDDEWQSITYANGLFVAVAAFSGDNRVMTSPDGITWTARSAAGNNDGWSSVTYGNGLFVAVGEGTDRVMTSPDGITWTARSAAGNNDGWFGVTYGNGLFVAVGYGPDTVMTSLDGITWTVRSAAGNDDTWRDVTYGNSLFVAVGGNGITDRVMTSPDGITWTVRSAAGNNDDWSSITYGNGLFVATAISGDNRVMTSPDGITWTTRALSNGSNWFEVTYGSGLFVAVGNGGSNSSVMTSPDGITWTARSAAGNNDAWYGVAYGEGQFIAVGGSGDRVMTYEEGDAWGLDVPGSQINVEFIDVKDSHAEQAITATDSFDSGNNINWFGLTKRPITYGTYTFDADNDEDESAWTFISTGGPDGLAVSGTNRSWAHDTNATPSATVGPTSGQGGNPDGYVYTEANGAALNDTFTMTHNQVLDAASYDWEIDFYWNQRGTSNLATVAVQTNENGAGWVTRGTYAQNGPDVVTSGTQRWNFVSLDLGEMISATTTQVRFLVTYPSSGTVSQNDFGLDTITLRGTVPVIVTGSSTIANHDAGQVSNAFSSQDQVNKELYAFRLTPNAGVATTTSLTLDLTGTARVESTDFSNIRLLRDLNNDRLYDVGDQAVGGAGVMSILEGKGTITFSDDFGIITGANYLVVADWTAPPNGSFMNVELRPSGVQTTNINGPQDTFGSVLRVQHNRNNRGGGGGSAQDIGGVPPEGDGDVGGGGQGGSDDEGQTIDNDPNFRRPSAHSGSWANGANAYDGQNGTYATTDTNNSSAWQNHNFGISSGNTIQGIEVRLELSGTAAVGTVNVELSWNGGESWTTPKTTPTLTTNDAVITLGGPSDLWGRGSWTITDFSDANFRVRLTGAPNGNTIRVDEIQARVYNQTGGGGGGGGGDI